jgi:alkylation response protein AidB-like acyl-CoA dehydrogenase
LPDAALLTQPLSSERASQVREYFAAHAAEVDSGARDIREGLRWLAQRGLLGLGLARDRGDQLAPMGALIAEIAEQCMSSAFALWCHHMVMEYASAANDPFPREAVLERLGSVDLLGSTALGTAMAHAVMGSPLTVRFRQEGDELVLDGRITWASNLLTDPDAALTVTAATDDAGRRIIVALPLDTPGVSVLGYPPLLALQSTRSSSVVLQNVRIGAQWIVADELMRCLADIRPRFLVLQSSFCLGLSRAAMRGVRADSETSHGVFTDDVAQLEDQLGSHAERLDQQLRQPSTSAMPMREFVQTRLDLAVLAQATTRLESTLRGGRAYRLDDPAGRRFREAAFLPVQSPTEGQLRWELARSAS